MTENEVIARLQEIFRDIFDMPELVLTPDTSAADIEDWDSMNHISITIAAERAFGVKFRTAEIEELKNIGDFAELILAKLKS